MQDIDWKKIQDRVNEGYCATCYTQAKKHGRPVRKTDVYDYPICGLCEARLREGLVRYHPSNGTEGLLFEQQCDDCRHYYETEQGFSACRLKILDQFLDSACEYPDSGKFWYQPDVLQTRCNDGSPRCPAKCLKFISKDDPNGHLYDPPPKDCEGQMFFGDLDVPVEVVPKAKVEGQLK